MKLPNCRRALVLLGLLLLPGTSFAHSKLAAAMKKHYDLRLVSCSVCHEKGDDKTKLAPFGAVVGSLLEGEDITKRLEAVKSLDDDDERKVKVYAEVEREFAAAMKKLDTMKTASGKCYPDAFKAGEIDGAKPRQ